MQNLFIYHIISADTWNKCAVASFRSFPTSPGLNCAAMLFCTPPASQGIITINQQACFFITSYNGHCMFGTYWLDIGSTFPFINHTDTCVPVFNICLSRAGCNTRQDSLRQAKWDTWSAINSNCLLAAACPHVICWCHCAGCDAQKGISSFLFPLVPSLIRCLALISLRVVCTQSNPLFCLCFCWVGQFDDFIVQNIIYLVHPVTPSASSMAFKPGRLFHVSFFFFLLVVLVQPEAKGNPGCVCYWAAIGVKSSLLNYCVFLGLVF